MSQQLSPLALAGVTQRLAEVRERIARAAERSGRDPADVTLVAVSKMQPVEAIEAVVAAGQVDLGESYVQEWRKKDLLLEELPIRWHLIGHLQTNKARFVAGETHLIHSVDSLRLAAALDRRGRTQRCLIEVNIADEVTKTGFSPDELRAAWPTLLGLSHLRIEGLMSLPPWSERAEEVRPWFSALRRLRDELATEETPLPELSMGMSGDFEVAIEEGATMVRVGTAIFGARG